MIWESTLCMHSIPEECDPSVPVSNSSICSYIHIIYIMGKLIMKIKPNQGLNMTCSHPYSRKQAVFLYNYFYILLHMIFFVQVMWSGTGAIIAWHTVPNKLKNVLPFLQVICRFLCSATEIHVKIMIFFSHSHKKYLHRNTHTRS